MDTNDSCIISHKTHLGPSKCHINVMNVKLKAGHARAVQNLHFGHLFRFFFFNLCSVALLYGEYCNHYIEGIQYCMPYEEI